MRLAFIRKHRLNIDSCAWYCCWCYALDSSPWVLLPLQRTRRIAINFPGCVSWALVSLRHDLPYYRVLCALVGMQTIFQKGGDVEDLCLTFSATTTAFGDTKVGDGTMMFVLCVFDIDLIVQFTAFGWRFLRWAIRFIMFGWLFS